MKIKRFLSALPFIAALTLPAKSFADDSTEVTRADAYIALGDELYGMAEAAADQLTTSLNQSGITVGGGGYTYTAAQQSILTNYNSLVAQSATWYVKVFGISYGITGGESFNLPVGFQFLNRDAFDKWQALNNGFLIGGNRLKNANLYAVNADFKSDIVAKTKDIVGEMQRLNTESRRIQTEYNNFKVSESDANGNAIGVSASELQAQNYSLNSQTQLQQYNGQSQSLAVQLQTEQTALTAKGAVVSAAQGVFTTNWSNLMNVDVNTGATLTPVNINANSDTFVVVFTKRFSHCCGTESLRLRFV